VKFPCQKCAACCRQVGKTVVAAKIAIENQETEQVASRTKDGNTLYAPVSTINPILPILYALEAFPYDFDELGCCDKLNKDTNLCTVYNRRPGVCRVSWVWSKFFSKIGKLDYYAMNLKSCHKLQDRLKLKS